MKPFPGLLALVVAATLTADAALALSCMKPDAVRLYTQARDSSDLYAIVIGQLQPDAEIAIPEPNPDGSGTRDLIATTRSRMSGRVLGETGFSQFFDREVDVQITCLSIWCGAPVLGKDFLAALRVTGGVPILEIGPCGGLTMEADQDGIDRLLTCHQTGECAVEW